MIPIIKDRQDDFSALNNYRPITISPVISKFFEMVLLDKFSKFMVTDDLQFGFKKGVGCSNAIFALRQVIEYFNDRRSNVYVASLDASKAFDRVNHFKLLSTLIRRGLPICFVNVIFNWYGKLSVIVRWNGHDSSSLSVLSGVRQGGILSPVLFNMYVDAIITNLKYKRFGCHIRNLYLGCIMYADDIILISSSVIELQLMLDLTSEVGNDIGINFNSAKSMCIVIGPGKLQLPAPMHIRGSQMKWAESIKYLGLTILADKYFAIDFSNARRKFFIAVNTILSKCKFTSDVVKLELMEMQCLPILMYGSESLNLGASQLSQINSWWNSVYRKLFGYNKWESIKEVICLLGRLDILHLVNMRRLFFIKRILLCNNTVMYNLMHFYLHGPELKCLQGLYSIDINWSNAKIKALTFLSFKQLFV